MTRKATQIPRPATARLGARDELRRFGLVAAALLALCLTSFGLLWPRFGLLHEDWFHFPQVANGPVPLWNDVTLRPLHFLPWKICGAVFGEILPGYYAVLFGAQWLAALLLFAVAKRYAPPAFAAAFAALAMVYPGDASHLWLSSIPLRGAWVLTLAAILLGERSRDSGRDRWMIPALALAALSLAIYEVQLFLLALWPGLALLLRSPWRRRQTAVWSLVPVAYLLWRFVYRPIVGAPSILHTRLIFDPVEMCERLFARVPFNLFVEGWSIGLSEMIRESTGKSLLFFGIAFAVAGWLGRRLGDGEAGQPGGRPFAVALLLIFLGILPVVPTGYWLGHTAGTFAARILAMALPGAALLLLLAVLYLGRSRVLRHALVAALLTVSFTFHYDIQRSAAENWAVQQKVFQALKDHAEPWPHDAFLVIFGLPPNRLLYDTPWGVGRMIQEATGEKTLSGIGISTGQNVADVLSQEDGRLLVYQGSFARVALQRLIFLDWDGGTLIRREREEIP